jgi:hypothetical protein
MKRWWFQIHLSTAIVMTFIIGGLTWVNCRHTQRHGSYTDWPLYADDDDLYFDAEDLRRPLSFHTIYFAQYPIGVSHIRQWNYRNAALDALVYIAVLVIAAVILERRIRRREARNP